MQEPAFVLLQKPLNQALLFGVLMAATLVLVRPRSGEAVWLTAGSVCAIFIVANTVLLAFAADNGAYFLISLLSFVLLIVFAGALVGVWFKFADSSGSQGDAMIFLIVIYHPIALLLAMGLKCLVGRF